MTFLLILILTVPELRIEVETTVPGDGLKMACSDVAANLGAPPSPWRLTLRQASSVEEFAAKTGRARFEAAALAGPTIWLQPPHVLSRFDEASILRHECVHAWLRAQKIPPLPRVIEESLAAWVSLQATRFPPAVKLDADQLLQAEKTLAAPKSAADLSGTLHRAAATMIPIFSRWRTENRLLGELRKLPADRAWDRTLWQQFLSSSNL